MGLPSRGVGRVVGLHGNELGSVAYRVMDRRVVRQLETDHVPHDDVFVDDAGIDDAGGGSRYRLTAHLFEHRDQGKQGAAPRDPLAEGHQIALVVDGRRCVGMGGPPHASGLTFALVGAMGDGPHEDRLMGDRRCQGDDPPHLGMLDRVDVGGVLRPQQEISGRTPMRPIVGHLGDGFGEMVGRHRAGIACCM